jgi:hypothetical protein
VTRAAVERVSVVCGCRDRHDALARALPTWLRSPRISEVIVVDWSSSTPVTVVTAHFADPRVIVARVEGEPRWVASMSHNLGVQIASGPILLRLDADYLLQPNFFRRHALEPETFFCGNWRRARVDNERHLTGTLYVRKSQLLRVNGYNERIVTYGYEDDDLFERLERSGLTRRDVDFDTVHHLAHPDARRTVDHDVRDLQQETARNKALARAHPWSAADRMTAWELERHPNGVIICRRPYRPDQTV